ncbi:MAG: YfdX family protein [Alphaproteobacteria bacterium]
MTTILSTGLMLGFQPFAMAADNITTDAVKTATDPISKEEVANPRVAAASFVEHVNFARVALAMKKAELARQHITQARNMVSLIKGASAEHHRVTEMESGRIVYQYDTQYKYHYFPILSGPVQVKELGDGPIWAKNDLAVTDADIVYLTLDLTEYKAEEHLNAAEAAIGANNFKEADDQLAKLIDAVVTVESRVSVPSDKAHDNIALARNFIAAKNYDGARYALKHADHALDEMQNGAAYKARLPEIAVMRKDVNYLQDVVTKKDPTLIEQANTKMDKWWKELKTWSKSES